MGYGTEKKVINKGSASNMKMTLWWESDIEQVSLKLPAKGVDCLGTPYIFRKSIPFQRPAEQKLLSK